MQDQSAPPGGVPSFPPPPPVALLAPAAPLHDPVWVRTLQTRQKLAIAAGIANGVGGVLVYGHVLPEGLGLVLALGVAVFVIAAAARLASHLYGMGMGFLCAVAMLIPLAWIAVLAVLCVKASKRLQEARTPSPGYPGATARPL